MAMTVSGPPWVVDIPAPSSGGSGAGPAVVDHVPAGTAWAATITPASFVARTLHAGGSVTITPTGVTSPSATVTIDYSNDYSTTLSSATLGTISANGAVTFTLPDFAAMPGLVFRIRLTSGTGTGGTVQIVINLSA
jgi:hypothetical protein